MVKFYENPTKHSGVNKEIFEETDILPLPSFFSFLFFLLLFSQFRRYTYNKKMLFHKNRNTQIRLYTTCEAFSTANWEGTLRTPQFLSPRPCRVNGSYKFTYTQKYISLFPCANNLFFITVLKLYHNVGPRIEIRYLDLFNLKCGIL